MRGALEKKIDNFLRNRPASGIVFQKGATNPAGASHGGRATGASAVNGRETTRKWRRKPLKSRELDSEIAIRRFAVAG
jgi:hypothetical protein